MKKVLIRIFVGFFLISSMLAIAPFHIAKADEMQATFNTNSIIGFQVQSEMVGVSVDYYWINYITVTFDDYYICGPVSYTLRYKTSAVNAQYQTQSGKFGVNGTSVQLTVMSSDGYVLPNTISFTSFNYSGTAYRQIDFLQQFPIESFPIQAYNLENNPVTGINSEYGYNLNMFSVSTNSGLYQYYGYKNYEYVWVCWFDKNIYTDTISDYINLGTNVDLVSCQVLYRFHYEGHSTSLIKVTVMPTTTGGKTMIYINSSDAIYMPVYFNIASNVNISTDFALRFGLSNRMLDAIESIKATQSSDSSSESLEDNTSEMIDNQEDLFAYEDDFNENMNDALDDINVNFNIGNTFGSKFLASATWVRQQFDALTSTSPFGSVLSFSLLLGLALLIIGKAVK